MLYKCVCFTAMWCLPSYSNNDVSHCYYHREQLTCQQCPWRPHELMSELKARMLVIKYTEGTSANRATAFNNASVNVAASITIILVPLCPSSSIQFICKSYGFNLENISQICQLLSKSIIITLAQTATISYLYPTDRSLCFYSLIQSICHSNSKNDPLKYKLGFIIFLLKTN